MKVTAITEGTRIIGLVLEGTDKNQPKAGPRARPVPGPKQKFHELEIPDKLTISGETTQKDIDKILEWVTKQLAKPTKRKSKKGS